MKKLLWFLCSILLILSLTGVSGATVITYGADEYTTPDVWNVISSQPDVDLWHGGWYTVNIEDFDFVDEVDSINIVFHNIYNYNTEDNWLEVWFFDDPDSLGVGSGWRWGDYDGEEVTKPEWENDYSATSLGVWSDTDGPATTNDVVFTIDTDTEIWEILLAYMTNGDSFGIGIDPDCHFYGDEITIEAPVPEPATMLLFGTGLIGLAGLGRKKFFKK